ncbi:MAG: GlsB/YeaQ/YmgE family stress response membrane protein [Steroidobacteraceae bacterium]
MTLFASEAGMVGVAGRNTRRVCGTFDSGWRLYMNFLWFLIVGLVAGWLAGTLVKGGGFGLVGDLIVGVVGAFVGGFLFSTFGVSAGGGLIGSIVVATIGAVVLLFLVRLIKRA